MWPIATFTCGTRAQIAGPVRIGDNYVCPECVAKVTVSAVFLPLNWRGMYDPDKPMTEPVETGADDKPSMTIREYFARYGRTP